MKDFKKISIIVPTLNEAGNVQALTERIDAAFLGNRHQYEMIFVDDYSTDGTFTILNSLSKRYPVKSFLKAGRLGKAYSLLEGFGYADGDLLAFVDADLQYPPESIPAMINKIAIGEGDIIVANRVARDESFLRTLASKTFAFIFGRLLHGLKCDVQSGLKVFRAQIVNEITISPTQWTFDLEFLINARNAGYKISTVDIFFDARKYGQSKINFLKTIIEIGGNAIKMRFKKQLPVIIPPDAGYRMRGAGIALKGKRFITHTILDREFTAFFTFALWQKIAMFVWVILLAAGFAFYPLISAILFIGILSIIYFIDTVFTTFIVAKSLRNPPEISVIEEELANLDEATLPIYSILCPLYKESAVLPGFLKALENIDWPKEKLDVLLLLEENDPETIATAKKMDLPSYVRTIIVPESQPKTKPKACNYGLSLANGKYVVIYDAEDMPEPNQLKKAFIAFEKLPNTIKCLQAKLNYHNPDQNMLTRLFTAEYSLWFEVMLPGLQSINTFIPLGGTSNHFRTSDLILLKGWDPFNVTEDCDLGARLFKLGFKTAIIDSITLEEANSHYGNWIRQRSRWIKGYMQTFLVHTRRPFEFIKISGVHALIFQLSIGAKTVFSLINPLLWAATIAYFAFRETLGPAIESVYLSPIFYMAVFSLIFGNFMYLYNYMIGCAKRGEWQLIKYIFFIPIYWFFMSIASYMALWQLFVKPHFWEKTRHGLNIKKTDEFAPVEIETEIETIPEIVLAPEAGFLARITNRLPDGLKEKNVLSSGSILMATMMFANFLNFLFNAFLGRVLSFEELGLIILVNTIWSIVVVFMGALATTINHKTALLIAKNEINEGVSFYKKALKNGIFVSIVLSMIWMVLAPFISEFLNISDIAVLLLFAPVFTFGVVGAAGRGFLNGNLNFIAVAAVTFWEAVSKFVFAIGFYYFGLSEFVYLSIPLSIIFAVLIVLWLVAGKIKNISPVPAPAFPVNFFSASFIATISSTIFLTLDIILAKHFLSPEIAGEYALVSLVGKIIFFISSLPKTFIISLVSRDEGLGRDPKKAFNFILGSVAILAALGFLAIGPFGGLVVPILFGAKALKILPFLTAYAFAMGLFSVSNALVTYHLSRKHYSFPVISIFASGLMTLMILGQHNGLADIISAVLIASAFGFVTVLALHILNPQFETAKIFVKDFLQAFKKKRSIAQTYKQRILVLNWRDTKHVYAGGAEIYVQEMAKEWVKHGNYVTIFCGNDRKNPRREIIDGVEIIRRGGFYMVYFWAFVYYFTQFRKNYDVIVDCHNGIPFFAPIYAREPVFCLMHHVHQEVFTRYLNKPMAMLARFLEKDLMPFVYRNIKFITVSQSSKDDIEGLGLGEAGVEVIHPGVDLDILSAGVKSSVPTVLYLGRFKAYKSIDILLHAFKIVVQKMPDAELVLAGSGDEANKMKQLADELGISANVNFTGKVEEEEKINLLQSAWVAVNPSMMEGWGITTIEANACGTPVVASNVSGLRDSINNPHTGYLVKYGDIDAFAEKILQIMQNEELREKMNTEAVKWAENFEWKKTSKLFMSAITNDLELD